MFHFLVESFWQPCFDRVGAELWHVNARQDGLQSWRPGRCATGSRMRGALLLRQCGHVGVPVAAHSMDLVLVEWLDSRRGEGWVRLDELESTVTKCRSVGWIVSKDKGSVTLAGHLGEGPDQCCGDITIPRCAIKGITPLVVKA
jgi:hypothetical protein